VDFNLIIFAENHSLEVPKIGQKCQKQL